MIPGSPEEYHDPRNVFIPDSFLTAAAPCAALWVFALFGKYHAALFKFNTALQLREAPLRKLQGLFGHCQNGEGGLNACQDGLGHPYIWVKMREEVPQGARLSEGEGGAIAIWAMPE